MNTITEHPRYIVKPITPTADYRLKQQNFILLQEIQRLRLEVARLRLTGAMGNVTYVSQSISVTQKQEPPSISKCLGIIGRELGGKDWAFAGKMAGCILEFYLENRAENTNI